MQLVFVTNIWNHYQGALGQAFADVLGPSQFRMVLLEDVPEERRQLGWDLRPPERDWLIGSGAPALERADLVHLVNSADVAMLGASPRWLQLQRAATGKLTFVASERIFKTPFGLGQWANPIALAKIWRFLRVAQWPDVHYLAIGEYAAQDARAIGAFGDRIWNWGYFVDPPGEAPAPRPERPARLLWLGRMLKWKRVDIVLKAVAQVCDHPQFGRLDVVGSGPEKADLVRLASTLQLGCRCVFHDPVSPSSVPAMMHASDICVLASDRNEGWGVVANEAMAGGAVLVAHEDAGASRQLVRHGQTGFLYSGTDPAGLAALLQSVIADRGGMARVATAAWESLRCSWLPSVAASRFIDLATAIGAGKPPPEWSSGPCSAPVC